MMTDNDEFLVEYISEAREHLANAEEQLLSLNEADVNHEAMDSCFRSLHTIKGGSGFLDLKRIQGVAHVTEQLLEGLNDGSIICTTERLDILLEASAHLGDLLEDDNVIPSVELTEKDNALIARLDKQLGKEEKKEAPASTTPSPATASPTTANESAPTYAPNAARTPRLAALAEAAEAAINKKASAPAALSDAIITELQILNSEAHADIPDVINALDTLKRAAGLPPTLEDPIAHMQTICDDMMFAEADAQTTAYARIRASAQELLDLHSADADTQQDSEAIIAAAFKQLADVADDGIPDLIHLLETLHTQSAQDEWDQKSSDMLQDMQDTCDSAMFADIGEQATLINDIRNMGVQLHNIVAHGGNASSPQEFVTIASDFIPEVCELLNIVENALLHQQDIGRHDAQDIVRSFHTIKSIASYIGLQNIAEFVHHIEDRLEPLRDINSTCSASDREFMLAAIDSIRLLCKHISYTGNDDGRWPQKALDICTELNITSLIDVCSKGESVHIDDDTSADSTVIPAAMDRVPRIGDLLVANGIDRSAVEEGEKNRKPGQTIGDAIVATGAATKTQVEKAAKEQNAIQTKVKSENTTRVSTERLDVLINLIGELLISEAMVSQQIDTLGVQDLQQSSQSMRRIVRDLQSLSMSLRMVPLKTTFRKMARAVHDTARKVGKKIEFNIVGEETEIDRTLVENLADPLLHMVRNAADHGIESAEKRLAHNKKEKGTITLSASQTSEHVVIELSDNGGGMDPEFLKRKAVEKGLIEASDVLTEEECYFLIFKAGFSTAETVTGISGRGVGMDVVRRNIQDMNGFIQIASELGSGSTFTIRLPLTTAILDVMLLRCGEQRFLLPITSIVEANRPVPEDIESILGSGHVYKSRGNILPLITLGEELCIPDYTPEAHKAIVIVVECYTGSYALQVDEILGQQQIVIKPLNDHFPHHPSLAGSAILGDGQVGLILDPNKLTEAASSKK